MGDRDLADGRGLLPPAPLTTQQHDEVVSPRSGPDAFLKQIPTRASRAMAYYHATIPRFGDTTEGGVRI